MDKHMVVSQGNTGGSSDQNGVGRVECQQQEQQIFLLEVTPKLNPAERVKRSQAGGSKREGEEVMGIPRLVPYVLFL